MKVVTAAVIQKDKKILIAKRRKGDPLENKWEFPGGKVEENETPENCLKRELFEEFEIKTEIKEFICSSEFCYDHSQIRLLAYKVKYVSGDIVPNVHDEIKWVTISELKDYDFAQADIPIVNRIIETF